MSQLHYEEIFWTLFSVQRAMFAAAFILVFLFILINLREAPQPSGLTGGRLRRELIQGTRLSGSNTVDLSVIGIIPKLLCSLVVIISLGLAWLVADAFFSQRDTYLKFRYGASLKISDPLFRIDIEFYVFQLPFYQLL